jgi:hypothetical protein
MGKHTPYLILAVAVVAICALTWKKSLKDALGIGVAAPAARYY